MQLLLDLQQYHKEPIQRLTFVPSVNVPNAPPISAALEFRVSELSVSLLGGIICVN